MAPYSLEAWQRYRKERAKLPEAQAVPDVEVPVEGTEEELLMLADDEEEEDFDDIYERWLDRCVDWNC